MIEEAKNSVNAPMEAGENIIVGDANIVVTKDDVHCLICKRIIDKKEIKESGIIICQNCLKENRDFGIRSPEKNIEYGNKIFLVFAYIKTDEYEKAIVECEKAIEISPATFNAWAYRALLTYLITDRQITLVTNAEKVIQYLNVAHSQVENSEELDNIAKTIAERINLVILSRIEYIKRQSISNSDRLRNLLFYIEKWFVCFNIYQNAEYLENIIDYYSGHRMIGWIDISITDFAGNYKRIDKFGVLDKIEFYKKVLKTIKPNYKSPEILGCEENRYPPMPLSELYKYKTQREITKQEVINSVPKSEKPEAVNVPLIETNIQEKKIETIEDLIADKNLFYAYIQSFIASLLEEWKKTFKHDNAFVKHDTNFYRELFLKKQFNIEGQLQTPNWYETKLDVNKPLNLPLNYLRNLEVLVLKQVNISFLPFLMLPKLDKVFIEDCYKGYQLLRGRYQGVQFNFDKNSEWIVEFQENNPNCKIIINNTIIF